jgi:hypothetical protein
VPTSTAAIATRLNQDCYCIGADVDALRTHLEQELQARGVTQPVVSSHPNLFSSLPVFLARSHAERMQRLIAAVEAVVASPGYQSAALAYAPAIARYDPKTRSVFLGYDFHIGNEGPRLIEINTNAGGAMLNAIIGKAQRACCPEVREVLPGQPSGADLENSFVAMLRSEWRLARGDAPLSTLAIVDTDPATQYLYPEFLLFQRMLAAHGLNAVIADPSELAYRDGALWRNEQRIDLVYNRLTDFYLSEPAHAALRAAYLADAAVITPHPRSHALYANKRNLTLLTDAALLGTWGVAESTIATLLELIPTTVRVSPDQADDFWAQRKRWFFKPESGFGSRGSYRGDKLTKKVFGEILQGDYIAQQIVAPSERNMRDTDTPLKVDIRNYVYHGQVQLIAARLYQGQTTNFRTPGGGFAPVYFAPTIDDCCPA